MAVEIGRAVFPPDRAALAQRNLGRLDRNVRTVFGITRPPRGRDGATGCISSPISVSRRAGSRCALAARHSRARTTI